MSFIPGVDPVDEMLPAALRGRTYRYGWSIWQALNQTPRDLEGLTVTVAFDGWETMTPGSGLVVNLAEGHIELVLTPAQTLAAPAQSLGFTLNLEESPTEVVTPVRGVLPFKNPN